MTKSFHDHDHHPPHPRLRIVRPHRLGIARALIQTGAVFVDAYRELNARKMFWVVLIISGIVVLAFATIGIDQKGLKFFGMSFLPSFNTNIWARGDFYKWMFDTFGVGAWLSWIATALALISTAGILPDMLTGGSIDLYLSKPISRLRLFLTKYVSALLFVGLQVGLFTFASFLVLGIRGGTWLWGLFLTIPIMLLFFSYLYSICALLGIVTRSTLAALLLTLLAWCFIWMIHTTEAALLLFQLRKRAGIGDVRSADHRAGKQDHAIGIGHDAIDDSTGRNIAAGDCARGRADDRPDDWRCDGTNVRQEGRWLSRQMGSALIAHAK